MELTHEGVPWLLLQALPQAPQLATEELVSTSQPLETTVSQSLKGAVQLTSVQALLAQPLTALARLQAEPQALQCSGVLRVSVSQPLAALASQLPNPLAQAPSAQAPFAQLAWALANVQAVAQSPQCVASVLRLVSQPLPTFVSQSPNPAAHAMAQAPAAQDGVPLVELQIVPQAPQLATLVCRLVSHPVAYCWSQFAQLASQDTTTQEVALHPATPFRTVHALPHPPQWATLLVVAVSHPSEARPLQLPKPALHAIVHWPSAHDGTPLASLQASPQPPQLPTLEAVSTSQPSILSALQSAQAPEQDAIWQVPETQSSTALGISQSSPQAPQFEVVSRLVSQPLAARVSQSANPALQPSTVHAPATQPAVPLGAEHALPQPPQLATSPAVLISQPLTGSLSQSALGAVQLDTPQTPLTQLGTPLVSSHL